MDSSRIFSLLLAIPAIVSALTIHEFAHAWTANRLGDDTARRLGRLTLDPMKHLDPIGSLMMIMGALVGFFIGWAKPVPFSPRNFGEPRRDAMLVAIAGPISNLMQVVFWLVMLAIVGRIAGQESVLAALLGQKTASLNVSDLLVEMVYLGVRINLVLATFNMLPLPPLDGHYVLEFLGPPSVKEFFDMIRPYSFLILLLIINLPSMGIPFDLLGSVLRPVQIFGIQLSLFATGFGWQSLSY